MNEFQKIKELEDRIAKLEAVISGMSPRESSVEKKSEDVFKLTENETLVKDHAASVNSNFDNENRVDTEIYSAKEKFIDKHKVENNSFDSESLFGSEKTDTEDDLFELSVVDEFFSKSIKFIKNNILAIIGFVMVLSAIAWFLGYAFAQGWIGVVGRVSMGYIFSSILLLIGNKYFDKKRIFGSLMLVISLCTVLMTTTLALNRYELFDQNTAYIIILAASALNILIGYKKNTEGFVLFSLIAALIAPFLTGVESDSSLFLAHNFSLFFIGTLVALRKNWITLLVLTYVFGTLLPFFTLLRDYPYHVIVYGFLFLSYTYLLSVFKNFSLLRVVGVIVSILYFMEIYSSFDDVVYPAVYAGVAWLLFVLTLLKGNYGESELSIEDSAAINISSVASLVYIFELQQDYLHGLTILGFSVLCLAIAALTKRNSFPNYLALTFSLTAVVLFVIATLVQAPTDYVPLVLVLQWGFVAYLAARIFRIEGMLNISNILWVPAYFYLFLNYIFLGESLTILNIVVFILLILFLQLIPKLYEKESYESYRGTYDVLTLFLASLFVWNLNQDIVQKLNFTDYLNIANATSLCLFTIAGLVMFSLQNKYKNFKSLSYLLLGITIVRLMFVEYWAMSLVPRVIVFLVIGLIFVSTAYFEKKYINSKHD